MQRGIATFTLDHGRCPPWLFERMVRLGREMVHALAAEMGPDEFIRRIADPVWFQSLGTVLAFDWNASGLTTILTAALKEAIRGEERDLGIFICGGKGKTSRKTPQEIETWGGRLGLPDGTVHNLTYNSRMSAKVDSALVQDGFNIYHHAFFFAVSKNRHPERLPGVEGQPVPRQNSGQTTNVVWTVIQQGMNTETQRARRYHWHSANILDLVSEPHTGIASQGKSSTTLNLAAKSSRPTQELSVELVHQGYWALMKDIEVLRKYSSPLNQSVSFRSRQGDLFTLLNLEGREYHSHPVVREKFDSSRYLEKILSKLTAEKPATYENLLAAEGVGPKTMRALALVGEVIYGAKPSYEDPARYGFAFGGKDGSPYPVDRSTYDQAISILRRAVLQTHAAASEKRAMLGRLG